MENLLTGFFYNPSRGNLKSEEVIGEIFNYMLERPEKFYEIIVGCDSASGESPHFPLAVVILRKGEGGRFFLKKVNYPQKKFYSWKERVLGEVLFSCQLALTLREKITARIQNLAPVPNYEFQYIHADVGENGQTRDMIKEVIGLIRGNGFEAKIKPESYVASVVADRYT